MNLVCVAKMDGVLENVLNRTMRSTHQQVSNGTSGNSTIGVLDMITFVSARGLFITQAIIGLFFHLVVLVPFFMLLIENCCHKSLDNRTIRLNANTKTVLELFNTNVTSAEPTTEQHDKLALNESLLKTYPQDDKSLGVELQKDEKKPLIAENETIEEEFVEDRALHYYRKERKAGKSFCSVFCKCCCFYWLWYLKSMSLVMLLINAYFRVLCGFVPKI